MNSTISRFSITAEDLQFAHDVSQEKRDESGKWTSTGGVQNVKHHVAEKLGVHSDTINFAAKLKAMKSDERDLIDFNENYIGYQYYEAQKLMPKAENDPKFKKLTDGNNYTLSGDAGYLANIGGHPFLLNQWKDPDAKFRNDPKEFVWAYAPAGSTKFTETYTRDPEELVKIIQGHMDKLVMNQLSQFSQGEHDYSSTQFNLDEGGYSRTQGSPMRQIRAMAKEIDDDDLDEKGREDEPHVTIKYGLHCERPDDFESIVSDFGSVEIILGKTAMFESKDSDGRDVVYLEVFGDDIHRLNKLICESTECTNTFPTYIPHVCLAYVKAGKGWKYTGDDRVEGKRLFFTDFAFSSKNGDRKSIPLVRDAVEVPLKPSDVRYVTFDQSRDMKRFSITADDLVDMGQLTFNWDESKHPRDHGKFAIKNGDRDSHLPELPKPGQIFTMPKSNSYDAMEMRLADLGTHVGVSHANAKDSNPWKFPKHQFPELMRDLHGVVKSDNDSDHDSINAVLHNKGTLLGRGNDGMAFDTHDGNVVKVASDVPFHWVNGIRDRGNGSKLLADSVKINEKMRSIGIGSLVPQTLVIHEGRAYSVMPKLDTETKMTQEQFDEVAQSVDQMHKNGFAVGDDIQVGIKNGKAYIYDVGAAHEGLGRYDIDDDKQRLKRLADSHGLKFETFDPETEYMNAYEKGFLGLDPTSKESEGFHWLKARNTIKKLEKLRPHIDDDMADFYSHDDLVSRLKNYVDEKRKQNKARSEAGNGNAQMSRFSITADDLFEMGQLTFTWDEKKHPRGHEGNPGQFAKVGSGKNQSGKQTRLFGGVKPIEKTPEKKSTLTPEMSGILGKLDVILADKHPARGRMNPEQLTRNALEGVSSTLIGDMTEHPGVSEKQKEALHKEMDRRFSEFIDRVNANTQNTIEEQSKAKRIKENEEIKKSGQRPISPTKTISEASGHGPTVRHTEATLGEIAKLHSALPGTKPIPVKTTTGTKTAGKFAFYASLGEAIDISVSSKSPHPRMTFAHEYGHFMDFTIGRMDTSGRNVVFASMKDAAEYKGENHPIGKLMTLIRNSKATGILRDHIRGPSTVKKTVNHPKLGPTEVTMMVDKGYLRYLLSPNEQFARAYAQYVATKSGDDTMRKELKYCQSKEVSDQWADDDFEPIAKAFDEYFESLGLKGEQE